MGNAIISRGTDTAKLKELIDENTTNINTLNSEFEMLKATIGTLNNSLEDTLNGSE